MRVVEVLQGRLFKSPTPIAGLRDVTVVRQSGQQRSSHFDIVKDLRPFCKAQIGRDHNAAALIGFGRQVKQVQWQMGIRKR